MTVLLVPGFPLHALALCVDALRIANREALRTVFDWSLASEVGRPVTSSSGIDINPDLSLDRIESSPITVLLAGYEPGQACTDTLRKWLRKQDRRGAVIGCVDTGALILGQSGLAGAMEFSVHQDARPGAREDYRRVAFSDRLFSFRGRRFSSAGGVATLDMMLELIERHQGRALADRVAALLNHERRVAALDRPGPPAIAPGHPALRECIDLMQTHLEDPLPLEALGRCVGLPSWTLRRLFKRHLGVTPAGQYRRLRLDRARQLLAYSHLSVAEVAAACGFSECASFSRAYTQHFGSPPSRSRRDQAGLPVR